MIKALSHATIYVLDQDAALAFYRDKLGFEVRTDARVGDFRWVTVGPKEQKDLEIVLFELKVGGMHDGHGGRWPSRAPVICAQARLSSGQSFSEQSFSRQPFSPRPASPRPRRD